MKKILFYILPKKFKINIINNVNSSKYIISLNQDGTVKEHQLAKYTLDDYNLIPKEEKLYYMQHYVESKTYLRYIDKYMTKIVSGFAKIVKLVIAFN